MGDGSKIGWLDTYDETGHLSLGASWNAVSGCTKVSQGCRGCYAEAIADRYGRSFKPRMAPEKLCLPLRWQRPRRIFVASVSDVFHEAFTNEYIAAQFGVMAAAQRHTFLLLTKRHVRMLNWFKWVEKAAYNCNAGRGMTTAAFCFALAQANCLPSDRKKISEHPIVEAGLTAPWPLPNLQLGVSVENQEMWDERWPWLAATPAAVRWVSFEPLLGPIDVEPLICGLALGSAPYPPYHDHGQREYPLPTNANELHWAVVGGESGAKRREMALWWAKYLVNDLKTKVLCPVHVKQDSGLLPGQQGKLPEELWSLKEYAEVAQ